MGWLKRLFGQDAPKNARQVASGAPVEDFSRNPNSDAVPPERVGINGEYDQSGLAKRVALAFDQDPEIDDINTVYIAQQESTVVLKGKVPNRELLNKMVNIARRISGATGVDTNQVTVA